MDARTQRRVKRETVREVDYAEFVKERTHKKNLVAREKRMLRRRVLRDEYMKNEELNKRAPRRDASRNTQDGGEFQRLKHAIQSMPSSSKKRELEARLEDLRKVLLEMQNSAQKIVNNMRKNHTEEEVLVSIPISDLRKILHAKTETQKATLRGMALGEINYQLWKIQKICEKYIK